MMDLQLGPTGNGLWRHKLNARDKHFWSVSVSMDLRIIIHRERRRVERRRRLDLR
jgi:hypothetical protein